MGRKVFVSYKYADPYVSGNLLTCRNYVDTIREIISNVHIYKGEEDGNDLSQFKDSTIDTKLKEKIRDSSVTIVLISKGMVEFGKSQKDQWIPREIKYSLMTKTVNGVTSGANGLLAVVIPDENDSYGHYFTPVDCLHCDSVRHNTDWLFEIIRNNMFNRKQPFASSCYGPFHEEKIHQGENHSYMHQVRWDRFIKNPTYYIELAIALRDRIDDFNVQKRVLI